MTVEAWAAIVGAFLPALVAVVNRSDWQPWLKGVVALGSSVAAGTVTALLSGDFTGASWATSVGIVFGSSQIAYQTWWKGSGISNKIEDKVDLFAVGMKQAQQPRELPRHAAPDLAAETESEHSVQADKKE